MQPVLDILFLAQRVPYPPDRGDRITTWNILRRMLDAGHRLRVACFLEATDEAESVRFLEGHGAEVFAERLNPRLRKLKSLPFLLSSRPLTLPYFAHRGLRARLRASLRARRPDVCFAYSSSMGFYLLALAAELDGVRKIAQFAELDSDKWAQYSASQGFPGSWIYAREAKRLLEWERRLAEAVDVNLVVSPVEKRIFEARIPGQTARVLPNGVDLEAFHPDATIAKVPASVVFTGVMNYLPNVDAVLHFCDSCWPKIRAEFPQARFFVVGSGPTPEIQALHGKHGVEVTGRVPSTVPWMQKACVGVAPLRLARGVQNKVLEAMACGLPTVCSKQAATGIDAKDPDHLRIAGDDAAMIDAVLALFREPDTAKALGQAARSRVEVRYAWDRILRDLDELLVPPAGGGA